MAHFLRRHYLFLFLVALPLSLGVFSVLVKASPPPSFSNVVIFATKSARIGQGTKVGVGTDVISGDIVVNEARSNSLTLEPGFELSIEPQAVTPSGFIVAADRLRVKQDLSST
jgi:hypothetical protein